MKLLLCFIILLLSVSVSGQDMQQYLTDTRAMIKEGKYPEALERCIWFHDHALEYEKGMGGVRLSYALMDWKVLADKYAPAMSAMIEIRDRKTRQLIDSNGSATIFGDVVAFNSSLALDEPSKSIELFQIIAAKNPPLSKICWFYVKDLLFAGKRYEIIRNYISNPLEEYENIKHAYLLDTVMYSRFPAAQAVFFKTFNEGRFVEHSLQLIALSIDNKDMKSAMAIQQLAILVLNDKLLQDAIPAAQK